MAIRQSASQLRARSVEVPVMSLCVQRTGLADAMGVGWEGTRSSARAALRPPAALSATALLRPPAPRGGRREGLRSGAGWGRAARAHTGREPGKVSSSRRSWFSSGCTAGSQKAGIACGVPGQPVQQTSCGEDAVTGGAEGGRGNQALGRPVTNTAQINYPAVSVCAC